MSKAIDKWKRRAAARCCCGHTLLLHWEAVSQGACMIASCDCTRFHKEDT